MNVSRLNDLLRVNTRYKLCIAGYTNQRLADFLPTYKPMIVECGWYNVWENNKYFVPKESDKEALKMILPPPNVTGTLHLGHALTVTVQDILARWHRMKGDPVVWIPGLDHAGIATQACVERHLFKTKGVTRSEIGREQFLSYVWEWKNQKEDVIKNQLKLLGASLDWSREYFTMSKDHSDAVTEAFLMLSEHNLLYRKKDLINWSPTLHSAISDIEVEQVYLTEKKQFEVPGYKEKVTFGQIAEIAYPIENSNEELIVATTRPETVFGDVAIAVHPEDERYGKFVGQSVRHPIRNVSIPIIADPLVIKEFGTGAVKVTPAHDKLDLTIARKHNLEIIDVIDENGNITDAGKEFKSLPRFIARVKVLDELSNRGLLKSVKDHRMSLSRCSRSNDIIEHLLKEQWFVRCKDMADRAVHAVKDGSLKIIPAVHEQAWYDWLENIRDWCISRQLWWGHRIPAYNVMFDNKNEWIVARTEEDALKIAQQKYGHQIKLCRDDDVLDTWFSSAILPFTAMGWPKNTQDLEKYYPLTLMETGHDILFFWVARMVMLSLQLTNRLPFKEILLHGVLCDSYGKKMSKTVGNVISPENIINGISLKDLEAQSKESHDMGVLHKSELDRILSANKKNFPDGIPQCGADALRMTLCSHNIKNQTVNFEMMECEINKFFCNKIWQACKYVLLTVDGNTLKRPENFTLVDRWILSRLSSMVDTVNNSFEERDFHKAIASIKDFIYYEYCDFYLEATKWGIRSENKDVIASHTYTLIKCLETFLRIIAPIMPFIADDLYKNLSSKLPGFMSLSSLLEAPYPTPDELKDQRDESLEKGIGRSLEIIYEIRSLLAHVQKKTNPEVHIVTSNVDDVNFYNENINLFKGGSKIWNISISSTDKYVPCKNSICYSFSSDCSLFIVTQNAAILEQIKSNIEKKKSKCEEDSKDVSPDRTVTSYG